MNREQLAHLVRAASRITGHSNVVVFGSQAVLGTWDDSELPEEATRSIEADLVFPLDLTEQTADLVDGAIGELSRFHQEFGYYAQGISIRTAVLPAGWEDRVVHLDLPMAEPGYPRFLEPHDLVVAKLVAGREKDREFVTALLHAELVDPEVLRERARTIDRPGAVIERVLHRIDACLSASAVEPTESPKPERPGPSLEL